MPNQTATPRANAEDVRQCRIDPTPRMWPPAFRKRLCKARARVEQAVGKLKRFKRIALRCEKTAQNYGSFVALALGFILIKIVTQPSTLRISRTSNCRACSRRH